jgi:ClpP class serine protease
MNYGLAKEIYGLNTWCVDAISFKSLSAILTNIQNGVKLDIPEQKYNSISLLEIKSNTKLIQREWQLDNKDEFDGIGVINLNGPITKGGGASSSGMIELSNQMLQMANDSRIKGFIILTDSGGGSSGAVDIMGDAIQEVKKTKPVYALVTKGGMAGSAAYGIVSNASKIFAEDGMSIVGSVGTMISMEGHKANSQSPDGTKHITIYATKSTEKNKAFEEAFNNDNYELITSELLDPINESFINRTLANRPQLKGTNFDNGHTKFTKDSVGSFIDGIASFNEVVQMILSDSKENKNNNSNLSLTNSTKKMTKEEIKQAHPEVYAGIVSDGASAERERVKSLLVYVDADQKAVVEAINSGAEISPSQREAFMVKMNASAMLANLTADGTPPVVTAETPTVVPKVATEQEKELESAMDFKL